MIDVSTDRQDSGLPTEAYVAVDTVREDGKPVEKTWKHLASGIGAEEAEEVGVEQLLRDVHNPTAGSLRYPFPSSSSDIYGFLQSKNNSPIGFDKRSFTEVGANSFLFIKSCKWKDSSKSSSYVSPSRCFISCSRSYSIDQGMFDTMTRFILAPNDLLIPFNSEAQTFRVNLELSTYYHQNFSSRKVILTTDDHRYIEKNFGRESRSKVK